MAGEKHSGLLIDLSLISWPWVSNEPFMVPNYGAIFHSQFTLPDDYSHNFSLLRLLILPSPSLLLATRSGLIGTLTITSPHLGGGQSLHSCTRSQPPYLLKGEFPSTLSFFLHHKLFILYCAFQSSQKCCYCSNLKKKNVLNPLLPWDITFFAPSL